MAKHLTVESYMALKETINTLLKKDEYLNIAYDVIYDVYCKVICRKEDWSNITYKYKREHIEITLAELATYVKWVE